MKLAFLPPTYPSKVKYISPHRHPLALALCALLLGGAVYDARAQFTFISDSATNSVYSGTGGWTAGDNGGFGMNAWSFSGLGANSSNFVGNPANDGMITTGIGTTAFALFANTTNSGYVNATRSFSNSLGVGDTFSFYWAMNWDSGSSGGKGFDIRSGGSTIFNVNNGGNAGISIGGVTPTIFNSSSFGTNPMLVTISVTTNGFNFTMSTRTNTSVSYSTNVVTSSNITGFSLYAGNQQGGGQRNPYYDDFLSTNSGVFTQGGTVANANTFTGTGALSIGTNSSGTATTLILSGSGNHNYTGATTISNGNTLIFAGSGTSAFASTIGGGGNLVMSNTAGTVVLTNANTYTGNTTVAAGSLLIGNSSALGSTGTLAVNSTGELELSNNLTINRAITLAGDGVSGAGALQSVSGTNTWQGTISNSTGTRINAASDSLLVVSGNINSGANSLFLGGSGNITVGGLVNGTLGTGNGALYKDGAGTLTLTNNNTTGLTGLVRLLGGTLSVTNANSLGSGTLELGGLTTQAILSVGSTTARSQNLLIQNASTNSVINVASASAFTVTGSLTQDGAFANTTKIGKAGAGTLILAGASGNTYNGQIQIGEGTVIAGSSTALGTNATTSQRGIDLGLNIADASQGNSVALLASNGVTVSQSIYVAPNTSSGLRTIGLSGNGSATFNNELFLDGTLTVDSGSLTNDIVTISGLVRTNSSGAGGGISKANNGILVLSGANNFTGGVTLSQGTIRVGNNAGLGTGTFNFNGGTLASDGSTARTLANAITLGGNVTLGDATGTGNLSLGAVSLGGTTRTLTVNNNTTISGAIANGSGTPGLTKAGSGTLTLSGANTYSGVTTVNAGVLAVAAANNLSTNPASGVTNQLTLNGGALAVTTGFTGHANAGVTVGGSGGTIDVATSQRLIQGGGLYGSGNLVKAGLGTLSLTNTSGAYAGAITVTNGTLQANTTLRGANISVGHANTVNGSTLMGAGQVGTVAINNNGRISPGNSVGILSVSNTLSFNSGGSYLWEITNGLSGSPGTNWDLITVDLATAGDGAGTLALDSAGTFTVNGLSTGIVNFSPTNNYTNNYFHIVRATNVTGNLSILAFVGDAGLGTGSWTFATNNSGLFLNYVAPGVSLVFTNAVAANQGDGNLVTNNAPGAFSTISDDGGITAVTVSNAAPLIFTNGNNSYSGVTTIEQGTLVAGANSLNGVNGAFGKASTAIVVGSTTTSSNANLLIGNAGVTVQRDVLINGGGTGTRTIGATNASGIATYSGNITVNTNVTLSASNSAGTTLFSGVIGQGGAGALTVAGSGQVVLSGANNYTNTTTVLTNATLIAANNSALGAGGGGTVVNDGGTLAFSNNISEDEAITISGTNRAALRNISGANTNTGTITLAANALISADAGTSLQLAGINLGATTRLLTFSNSGTILVTGNMLNTDTNTTFYKLGSGSLVYSNTSGYTGGAQLQIAAGVFTLASGTFSTNNSAVRRGLDLGLNPDNSGSTLSAAFYANGGITISNSAYVAGGIGARILGTESTSGTATFNNEIFLDRGSSESALNLYANTGGTAVFSGVLRTNNVGGGGFVTKTGGGTVILSAVNTAVGTLTIGEGTLAITNGQAIANVNSVVISNVAGATLRVDTEETIAGLSGGGATGGAVVINGSQLRSRVDNAVNTFAGVISGAGNLLKGGTSTLTLSGNNTYAGGTEHEAGTLIVGNNSALGSGTYTASGTTNKVLAANGSSNFTVSQNNNIFADNLTIGAASGNTGKLTFAGTTFLGNENDTRFITVIGTHEFSGAVTGQRGIVKQGSGNLILSGVNTFTNGLFIDEGTVELAGGSLNTAGGATAVIDIGGGANASAAAGSNAVLRVSTNGAFGRNITVNAETNTAGSSGNRTLEFFNTGGTAALTGTVSLEKLLTVNVTNSGAIGSLSNVVSGSGGLTKVGSGTLLLAGNNTYSGGTLISAGDLQVGAGGTSGSLVGPITNNASLVFNRSDNLTQSGLISGTGNLVKLGDGTLTFTADNSYNGGTLISAGALQVGAGGTVGSLTGPITNNAALIFNRSDNLTESDAISGTGSMTKLGAGTLTLTAENTYGGGTLVSAGALQVGAGGTVGSLTGPITNNSALIFNRSDNLTESDVISGNGTLTKLAAGTLTLSGNNSYSGATTVSAGALRVADDNALGTTAGATTVANGAALELSSGITTAENITITGSGIGGAGAIRSIGDGQNTISGNVTLGGNARIGVDAPVGTSVTLLDLGTAGFTVDTGISTLTSFSQTLTTLSLSNAFSNGDLIAGTASGDWSSYGSFGLVMSVNGANGNLPFTLGFYDGGFDPIDNLFTYSGSTTGIATNGVSATVLLNLLSSGIGDLSDIQGLVFSWGDDGSINTTLSSIVAVPTSGLTISGNINGGANVLTVGSEAAGAGTVSTGLLISGQISGAGASTNGTVTSLVKDGTGTVTLTGHNTFTGDIRVTSGTLAVGAGAATTNALGNNSDVFLSAASTLSVGSDASVGSFQSAATDSSINLNGAILTVNGASKTNTMAGALTGSGGLRVNASGARVTLTGNNTFGGTTFVDEGTLELAGTSGNQALGGSFAVNVDSGATLLLSQNDQVNDTATITLSGGTIKRQGSALSEVFGNLNVTSASILDFDGGAGVATTMTFSGLDYTPSALLSLQLFNFSKGSTLVINNTSDWGNPSLLGSGFTFAGSGGFGSYSFSNGTFTITAIPEPSTYLAAAGLLALFLWPVRRRLLKDTKAILGLRAIGRERIEAYRNS